MTNPVRTCSHCGQEQPLSQFQRKCLDRGGPVVCATCAARAQQTINDALGIIATGKAASKTWQDDANCLGFPPDMFFPERGESTREARAVCADCHVRAECLAFAFHENEEGGFWGGLSGRERRQAARRKHLRLLGAAS